MYTTVSTVVYSSVLYFTAHIRYSIYMPCILVDSQRPYSRAISSRLSILSCERWEYALLPLFDIHVLCYYRGATPVSYDGL